MIGKHLSCKEGKRRVLATCHSLIGTSLNETAMKCSATQLNYRHG